LEDSGIELRSIIRAESHGHAQLDEIVHDCLDYFSRGGIASPLVDYRPTR
jgi:hypothetical protein